MARYTVRNAEQRSLDCSGTISNPSVQFRPPYSHEAACHVEPDGVIVVLHGPMHAFTRQPVLARESRDAVILDAAQPSFRCRPEPAVGSESKLVHPAASKPIGGRVRFLNSTVSEVRDSTLVES